MKELISVLPNMKKENMQKGLLTVSQTILTGLGNGAKFLNNKKMKSLIESARSMTEGVDTMKIMFPELHVHLEKWKYHVGLDCYISNYGRIKDKDGKLQTVCKRNGYIWYKGKAVHRLVLETFNPQPGYSQLSVDHINHNTYQNDIWNLRWMTAEENNEQDKIDIAAHAPVEITAPKIEKKKEPSPQTVIDQNENEEKDFILNSVKMNSKYVRKILINDKSLSKGGYSSVDKAMNKAINAKGPTSFGNFTIQYIGKSN